MTDEEKEFEEFFDKGCYYLRMAMPQTIKVEEFIKEVMQEAYLEAKRRDRERIEGLEKRISELERTLYVG